MSNTCPNPRCGHWVHEGDCPKLGCECRPNVPIERAPRPAYHKHTLTPSYYVTTTPPLLGRACTECGLEQEQQPHPKSGHPTWTTTKEGSLG